MSINYEVIYPYSNFMKIINDNNSLSNVGDYPYPWKPNFWEPVVINHYPCYVKSWESNKTEKAFEVVKLMIEKKYIKIELVKDFIECVNEISKIL